jgi:hypothetical protein
MNSHPEVHCGLLISRTENLRCQQAHTGGIVSARIEARGPALFDPVERAGYQAPMIAA